MHCMYFYLLISFNFPRSVVSFDRSSLEIDECAFINTNTHIYNVYINPVLGFQLRAVVPNSKTVPSPQNSQNTICRVTSVFLTVFAAGVGNMLVCVRERESESTRN